MVLTPEWQTWHNSIVYESGRRPPGGAQLSALWLSVALRAQGIATTLLAGDATPAGLELAARYGLPADAYRVSEVLAPDSLQWTPASEFADWLGPRLARADLVHAHMVGAWWAAARAVPPHVPLVASEHNQMSWPPATTRGRPGMRHDGSTCSSRTGRRCASGQRGSAWTTAGCAQGAPRWKACPQGHCRDFPRRG